MKITTKLITEVKKMNRKKWHDESWWEVMRRPEVMAITFALSESCVESEILKIAENFMAVNSGKEE